MLLKYLIVLFLRHTAWKHWEESYLKPRVFKCVHSPFNSLHRPKEDKRLNRLVVLAHSLKVFEVILLESLNLLQILLFKILLLLLLGLIFDLFYLHINFFNDSGDFFNSHDVVQELVITHRELYVDDLTAPFFAWVWKLGDLMLFLLQDHFEMVP